MTRVVIPGGGSVKTATLVKQDKVDINTQTDDYTLTVSDAYGLVEMNKATANNFTIPADLNVQIGAFGFIKQLGAGQTTIVAGSGVTLRYVTGLKINAQYGSATWLKRGANEYYIDGDLET